MQSIEKRSSLNVKIDNLIRLFFWYRLQKKLNLVLVSEFPKSGGTWFCQMLSEIMGIPFQRNTNVKYIRSILHWHLLYKPSMNKMIYVLRDGRDVMVSAYFHFLFEKDENQELTSFAKYHRKQMGFIENYDDIEKNMPKFIDHLFTSFPKKTFTHFSWSEGVKNAFQNENVLVIKYEDLLIDPVACLERALQFYDFNYIDKEIIKTVVDKFSFESQTNRKKGDENRTNFIRKGIRGDWKNYFNEDSKIKFKKFAGKELILAQYEEDENW